MKGDCLLFRLKARNNGEFRTVDAASWSNTQGGRVPFVGINVCSNCGHGKGHNLKGLRDDYRIAGGFPDQGKEPKDEEANDCW